MQSKDNIETESLSDNLGQMYGIGIMAFVLMLSTLIGVPVLPALAKELGASSTEAAFVISSALMTVVIVQFFAGVMADKYSKRKLILTGALIGSLSSLLCIVATNWVYLAALRIIGGIADAVTMPALLATTASLGRNQPGKFFGILRASQGLSFVVGPALGAVFSLYSLRTPFFADGVLSLLAFFTAFKLIKGDDKARSGHDIRALQGFRMIFSIPHVYLYLLMGISGLFGYGILNSFIPLKSQTLGMEAWQIGIILAGGALSFSFISFLVGTLSDRAGRKVFVVLSQLVIVIGCAGLALCNTFVTILTFYCIFCIGEATTFLLSFVYASEIFYKKHIGTSMGVFDSLMDLSLFFAPLLAISFHKAYGSIPMVIMISCIPAILAFISMVIWLPHDLYEKKSINNAKEIIDI